MRTTVEVALFVGILCGFDFLPVCRDVMPRITSNKRTLANGLGADYERRYMAADAALPIAAA